ncbi:MAG: NusG domain II-containing protein [Sterolibacterium sp.]|jgi:hypothetical protein|nr:NusG domain II-containing protein [Sterolibacterium sp.]
MKAARALTLITHARLLKPGDVLILLLGAALCAASFPLLWRGGAAQKAVIRSNGQIVAELGLNVARRFEVSGPLGMTVIEVEPGRARVLSDPGPRQYCVHQGWLTQANAIAICAPNRISLALVGRESSYDSLSY